MIHIIATLVLLIGLLIYLITPTEKTQSKQKTGGMDIKHFIILPNQLFHQTEAVRYSNIHIIEDPTYFTKYKFHKLKLIFHRATMRTYADQLRERAIGKVNYINFNDAEKFYKTLNQETAVMYDPVDDDVEKRLQNINILPTPYFLNTRESLEEYRDSIKGKSYRHDSSFYPWMRKKYNVLMTKDGKPKGGKPIGGKPIGGKYTYDSENRNPFPDKQKEPKRFIARRNKYIDEAVRYVERHFKNNYGETTHFVYPHTHAGAIAHLRDFLKRRLKLFGKYQDAAASDITFGYHSVISSSLNAGLITPREVLDELDKIRDIKIPINSLEGFIRQLIGWREYCHLLYRYESDKMRKSNYFNHTRKLTDAWWEGKTGLGPIDDICARINKYAYAHHIERLMWLSAVMLMCGVAPNEVYEWFIGFVSIDAYDWVMTPNIYGMGTYADGGIMMTRPYFSSFNYIKKMSNWNDPEDAKIWNALYYNFIGENKTKLKKNYYTARWVGNYDSKSASERKEIKEIADRFITANTK